MLIRESENKVPPLASDKGIATGVCVHQRLVERKGREREREREDWRIYAFGLP